MGVHAPPPACTHCRQGYWCHLAPIQKSTEWNNRSEVGLARKGWCSSCINSRAITVAPVWKLGLIGTSIIFVVLIVAVVGAGGVGVPQLFTVKLYKSPPGLVRAVPPLRGKLVTLKVIVFVPDSRSVPGNWDSLSRTKVIAGKWQQCVRLRPQRSRYPWLSPSLNRLVSL